LESTRNQCLNDKNKMECVRLKNVSLELAHTRKIEEMNQFGS
jgi:hypothetical protein